ncbi:MAG: lysophospholipid acyltransferase family protein [Candidatus Omnitrophota bacterium]
MLYSIARTLIILFLRFFCRFDVTGRENVPKKEGFILASNHLSILDPMVLGAACPRKLNFMAKYELFKNPLFSRCIRSVGAIPLKRGEADRSALKEGIRRLKNGAAVVLFPQGSRIPEGDATAQPGVVFLAFNSGVPIIPAFIKGTDSAMPKGARFIRPAKIMVSFGKPISIERRCKPNYQEAAGDVMSRIRELSCA